ncbi:hypothetical protein RW_GP085c [Caulobacter phage RW]|nr:hypothetical protein RW_GP085c [Caulobacter phage RW]
MLERYDFSQAQYDGALKPIENIVCPKHGPFAQYSGQLRKPGGAGCPACGGEVRASKKRLTNEQVRAMVEDRYGDQYTLDRMVYRNTQTKIIVTCKDHGDFATLPVNFLYKGKGCSKCGAVKRGRRKDPAAAGRKTADAKLAKYAAAFVEDARKVHGDVYDYSRADYQGRNTKVEIVCPKHGSFTQKPYHHLARNQGCPECSHHRSKGETAILKFVSIFAEAQTRNRSIVPPKELDIYLPEHKLAIEYCGEYWHGSRNADEEAFARTRHIDKMRACEAQGIRLLTVFENEWLERPHAIKRLIRNVMGKSRGKVMARKCELERVPHAEAAAFFEAYHPQGGGGWGEHYGLYWNDKLVACMRFTHGANDRGANATRVWTLARYATRVTVQGGASRLLSAFREEHPGEDIKSFSDNRYFTGGMYEALGFTLEEESAPDYQVYHIKTGLLPKAAWQRRAIPARIREIGSDEKFDPQRDVRSEREMTYLLEARRVYDCGKKRWVLRA